MKTVTSKDGTTIAYDQRGTGQPLILVGGAMNYRTFSVTTELSELLSSQYTVIDYDRRGRGDSGDTQPYAVEREIEDIEALLDVVGGSAYLWGLSSGAALALETANKLNTKVKKLALYEAPYFVDNTRKPIPPDYQAHMTKLVAEGRRADAIKYFMKDGIGVPGIFVFMMRFMSAWPKLMAVAHTLPYDVAAVVDYEHNQPLPAHQWDRVTMPTLVMCGGKSPQWMKNGMQALNTVLPNSTYYTLEDETHIVKAKALAPVLKEYFR